MNIPVYLLTDAALNPDGGTTYSISLIAVIAGGFIAAAVIGSIAWFNSKRPVGWEDKERPDVVPKVDQPDNPGV